MTDHAKLAKRIKAFRRAIEHHDRKLPSHRALGIGLSAEDWDALDVEEARRLLPGWIISCDGGRSGSFRILCDGDHPPMQVPTDRHISLTRAESSWTPFEDRIPRTPPSEW